MDHNTQISIKLEKISIVFWVFLLAFAAMGCSTNSSLAFPLTQEPIYAAVAPEKIAVFVTDKAPFPYERMAHLSAMVDSGQNPRIPVEILKEKAAEIGADAIVELRLNFGSGFFTNGLKATGMAVKFK